MNRSSAVALLYARRSEFLGERKLTKNETEQLGSVRGFWFRGKYAGGFLPGKQKALGLREA